MSKTTMKTLKEGELVCYVCKKEIKDLRRLRYLANRKDGDTYFTDRAIKLRHRVNMKVIEITGCNDNYRVYRHSRCDPVDKTFSSEDL